MNLDECFRILMQRGYCLWLGAGASTQLAGKTIPGWPELTEALELEAKLHPPPGLTYPERLDAAFRGLGRKKFQRALRTHTLDAVAQEIGRIADARAELPDLLPPGFRQLARLGYSANPIVNFNIEHLTSVAATTGTAYDVKAFVPPIPGAVDGLMTRGPGTQMTEGGHARHVYHPHGAIEVGGICVITQSEYDSLDGTLALELAVHAAFRSVLLIVGMSLQDEYLRKQLARFRSYIDRVLWVRPGDVTEEDARWCYRTRVDLVQPATWADFWTRAGEMPAGGLDETKMLLGWISLLHQADHSARPDVTIRELEKLGGGRLSPDWYQHAVLQGRESAGEDAPLFSPDNARRIQQALARLAPLILPKKG